MTELDRLLAESAERTKAMTPEAREEMYRKQGESYARACLPAGREMTPEQIRLRIAGIEDTLTQTTSWGAAVSEMSEELEELKGELRRRGLGVKFGEKP